MGLITQMVQGRLVDIQNDSLLKEDESHGYGVENIAIVDQLFFNNVWPPGQYTQIEI